jgi:tRNA pseudouridine38-40 synthase
MLEGYLRMALRFSNVSTLKHSKNISTLKLQIKHFNFPTLQHSNNNYLYKVTKQRYFIELSYEGTNYHGWQIQKNAVSVQGILNQKLSIILREPIDTTGCGRTDTGVHAKEFFAHFDAEEFMVHSSWFIDNDALTRSINAILPCDIAAKRIFPVAANANARFDATLRSYEYHIHFNKDPFKNGYSWELRDYPDLDLMNEAAKLMMEYTDFSCFSKSNTQVKTNICKITKAEWNVTDNGIVFQISADRFLRNMVRAIVGTLIMVCKKEIEPGAIRQIIESKNRSNAGTSVPACGLYLTKVEYPPAP